MSFECVGKKLDEELTRRAQQLVPCMKVYKCKAIHLRGRDVTKYIRGMYRPESNEIWLTPQATPDTLAHELAHAKICYENPELCRQAKQDINLAMLIEKQAEKLGKQIKL